jgi:hypothetical protein
MEICNKSVVQEIINQSEISLTDKSGLAMRQLPRGILKIFLREFGAFWKWFEVFSNISIRFEDIFREIQAFLNNVKVFQRLRGFLNIFLVKLKLF